MYKNVNLETSTWKKEVFIVPGPESHMIRECFLDHMYLYIVEQDIHYFNANKHVNYEPPLVAFWEGYEGEQCILGVDYEEDFFYVFTGDKFRYILVGSKSNIFSEDRKWIPYGSRTLFQDLKRIKIFDHYLYFLFRSEIHIYSTTASQDTDLLQIVFLREESMGESIESVVFMKSEMYVCNDRQLSTTNICF